MQELGVFAWKFLLVKLVARRVLFKLCISFCNIFMSFKNNKKNIVILLLKNSEYLWYIIFLNVIKKDKKKFLKV